jgi:hypothetical protein
MLHLDGVYFHFCIDLIGAAGDEVLVLLMYGRGFQRRYRVTLPRNTVPKDFSYFN